MKLSSVMKQVEWDVMKEEGSTEGYRWYYDQDGNPYYMSLKNLYIPGNDGEWVRRKRNEE